MKRYLTPTALFAAAAAFLTLAPVSMAADVVASGAASASNSQEAIFVAEAPSTSLQLAKGDCKGGGCGPKFNLTDSQMQQLRALRDKYSVDNATKKAQLQVLQHDLMSQLGATTIDKSAALATQSKINNLRNDLSNAKLAMKLDASGIFTPEQREQMHKRMSRGGFGGKHHGRGGRGGHGHHGGFHRGPGGRGPVQS